MLAGGNRHYSYQHHPLREIIEKFLFHSLAKFSTVKAWWITPRAEGYIQIDRCEVHDAMVNCIITNKLPDSQIGLDVGDIGVNLLSATYYDKKGREIGRTHLPVQKIPSGEPVRGTVARYRPIGDIDTITIDWK